VFETCICFKNCTGFDFFLICIEPICIGWIKSVDTNNLILVSAYLTQQIPIYSLLISAVLGQLIPKIPDFSYPINNIGLTDINNGLPADTQNPFYSSDKSMYMSMGQ
jgi:hypothetical protein